MKPKISLIFAAILATTNLHAADMASAEAQGDAYAAKLDSRHALESYIQAAKLGQPDAKLICNIAKEYGETMADTNNVDEKRQLGEKALEYAKRAVTQFPGDAVAQLSLAVCYGRLAPLMDNRTKIAYSRQVKWHAEKALQLDPNNDLTYNVLGAWNYELAGLNPFLRGLAGMIYGKLPDASYDESVKYYKRALELNPNRLANHIGLGRTYVAMGRTAEGKAEIEQGLAMPDKEKDDPYTKDQGHESLKRI